MLASVGFTVINVVVCGQLLSAVSDYKISINVGIYRSCSGYIIHRVFVRFSAPHTFEKYFWIMTFVLLCVFLAQTRSLLNSLPSPAAETGKIPAGEFLTFLAINLSSASGWCTVVSDYCNYPSSTPAWKLPTLTLLGISLPTIFQPWRCMKEEWDNHFWFDA